jgi:hypothetical protein
MQKMGYRNSNNDLSFEVYQKYFSVINPQIEITLKNTEIVKGKIVGYFYGDINSADSFIVKWHIAHVDNFTGTDTFGHLEGYIIKQQDIASVLFFEDNTLMCFRSL